MLPLSELQIHFKNSYKNNLNSKLNKIIKTNKIPINNALQIYHNNFYIGLTDCLQKIYTTIHQLIGDECFIWLAKQYIDLYQPLSGDIHEYGSNFAQFLAHNSDNKAFPYLVEVAQLDWAYHQIFHAEDCVVFDLHQLKNVGPEQYNEIKFKLNPTAKLFSFNFPIFHIWQICQNENKSNERVYLTEGGEKIIIFKCHFDIFINTLSQGEYEFINALNHHYNFARVCTIALQAEPTMNIKRFLQKCLSCGTIVGLR